MLVNRIAAAALALLIAGPALAQSNQDLSAIITNQARGAGTVTSARLDNPNNRGVICVFAQTAIIGAPTTIFSIQGYDLATQVYRTLATSLIIESSTTDAYAVTVYPGAVAPTDLNSVVAGASLPRYWRVSQTIGGTSSPTTTGRIGCNLLL